MNDFWLRYASALLVLGLVLVAFTLLARLLRRARFPRGATRLEIVESLALAPQSSLFLVRFDSREVLVGAGRLSALLVGELLDRVEPAVGEVDLAVESDHGLLRD